MDSKNLARIKPTSRWRRRWQESVYLRKTGARLWLGLAILLAFAAIALLADFLAPYDYRAQSRLEPSAPDVALHLRDTGGKWHLRPFIYPQTMTDPLARTYAEDNRKGYGLALFVRGYSYRLFGLFPTNLHLFGVQQSGQEQAPRAALLGTDALGRDRFSRMLIASRFSLVVAPLSTLLASLLGIGIGCLAGYGGRLLDGILMRVADAMMALPALVVVLAARAAFPLALSPGRAGFLLVAIFVAAGWAEMARLARGEVLALRQREFVVAACSLGLGQMRILFRHILPNMSRPLVVQMTLMLPAFLLNETALSFLGVGLQEPEPGWGNMLAAANDLTLLQTQPFLLLAPALAIFIFVLGVRLLSEGFQSLQRRD